MKLWIETDPIEETDVPPKKRNIHSAPSFFTRVMQRMTTNHNLFGNQERNQKGIEK